MTVLNKSLGVAAITATFVCQVLLTLICEAIMFALTFGFGLFFGKMIVFQLDFVFGSSVYGGSMIRIYKELIFGGIMMISILLQIIIPWERKYLAPMFQALFKKRHLTTDFTVFLFITFWILICHVGLFHLFEVRFCSTQFNLDELIGPMHSIAYILDNTLSVFHAIFPYQGYQTNGPESAFVFLLCFLNVYPVFRLIKMYATPKYSYRTYGAPVDNNLFWKTNNPDLSDPRFDKYYNWRNLSVAILFFNVKEILLCMFIFLLLIILQLSSVWIVETHLPLVFLHCMIFSVLMVKIDMSCRNAYFIKYKYKEFHDYITLFELGIFVPAMFIFFFTNWNNMEQNICTNGVIHTTAASSTTFFLLATLIMIMEYRVYIFFLFEKRDSSKNRLGMVAPVPPKAYNLPYQRRLGLVFSTPVPWYHVKWSKVLIKKENRSLLHRAANNNRNYEWKMETVPVFN